jgi:hypothetical protein
MTTFHLDHHGDEYRIEIHDDRFVMLHQDDEGDWNVEAEMSLRAAEVLATLDPTKALTGRLAPRRASVE